MSDREAALAWLQYGIGADRMRASLMSYDDEDIRFTNLACVYLSQPFFRVMACYEITPLSFRMSQATAAREIHGFKPNQDWRRFVEIHRRTIQEWYPQDCKSDSALLAIAEREMNACGLPLAMIAFGRTDLGEDVAILCAHGAFRIDLALDRLREACRHLV